MKIARPASFDAPASEWLVWGDALQETGDVRGELVGLSHAVDEGRTPAGLRDAYVTRYATQLLGHAANHLAHYKLHWKYCELSAVEVRIGTDDDGTGILSAILDAPTGELLHDVTLVGSFEVPGESVDLAAEMAVLGKVQRITSLGLVDERARNARMLVSRDFDADENGVSLGWLAPFWNRLQHLSFDVADSYQLADLENVDAPELRSFALRNLHFSDWEDAHTMCNRLAKAKWPKLESFELRLVESFVANVPNEIDPYIPVYSAEDGGGRDDTDDGESEGIAWDSELPPVLATLSQCPLRRLALTSFESSGRVLEALAASGLLPMLEELDLSDSNLGPEDVEWFVEHRELFTTVRRLILQHTSIGEEGARRLADLGPQLSYSEAPSRGARYRYVVGQE